MKLVDLATCHPGGWQDIIDTIKRRWPELTVKVVDKTWGVTTRKTNRKGEEIDVGTKRLVQAGAEERTFSLAVYLENLERNTSGMLAGDAHAVLLRAGLPVPGDKSWLQPASTWERRHG
jgi:hypothetical protein